MEVESEYGEGKEKEVPPLPLPRCAWIDMVFSNARNTLANKNNSCVHTIQKCKSALIGH